jgi:hypothetical protein
MTNVNKFLLALAFQVGGNTPKALELMQTVEPMQPDDSRAVLMRLLLNPLSDNMIDLLVNSAIVGMTDNRESASEDASDKDDLAALLFLREIACQKPERN